MVLETNHSSYSKSANAGLRAARRLANVDAIGLLNSDALPASGWLRGLRKALFAAATDDDLRDAFDGADADGDGFVDASELAAYADRAVRLSVGPGILQGLDASMPTPQKSAETVFVSPNSGRRRYALRPDDDFATRLEPWDADGDGRLAWAEACPPGPDAAAPRGCDSRTWTCRARGDVAGLRPAAVAAVGALSNAASHQTVR